jgi:hypothetical protein
MSVVPGLSSPHDVGAGPRDYAKRHISAPGMPKKKANLEAHNAPMDE